MTLWKLVSNWQQNEMNKDFTFTLHYLLELELLAATAIASYMKLTVVEQSTYYNFSFM